MANILITGASKGLGRATARELTRRGHHVIATARKVSALDDLEVAQRVQLDVTDDESVRKAKQSAGHVDILINNAGEIFEASIEKSPIEEVRRLYDINVFGMVRTIQAFVPEMRERRAGTIVNLSSVVGKISLPITGIYSSTKFAIEALSESLRRELEAFGVNVALVEPGMIGTGALDAPRSFMTASDPYRSLLRARPAREHMTSPEAVAKVIADAAENPQQKFRWVVGEDAQAMLAKRAQLDDAAFHAFLRDNF